MSDYTTYLREYYQQDLRYTRQFLFSFGSNYSLATRLFSKKVQEATIIFYAFLRYSDELVDNPKQPLPGQSHNNFENLITDWKTVVKEGVREKTHPILRANYYLFQKYEIPFEYSFDFLDAMKIDLSQKRYQSYVALERYMWGSAAVVGHVMTFIVGYRDKVAFDHARALGEAMQLANFLRDFDEDYQLRNRIYLPLNDMKMFGVTEEMIQDQRMTSELRNFIAHYIDRTEKLFQKGMSGIKYLKNGKFSIFLASRIYRENIRILKERDYNIFGKQIKLSKMRKTWILANSTVLYFIGRIQ